MHKVHALVNFLLILACNDLMHLGIWTCVGDNQIEPYKMEKLKFWDKPYKTGKEGVEKEVLHPGIVPHFETRTVNKFWACVSSHSKLLHAILNCKPVHTDHNLNGFPLRSVLVVLGYKYYYAKMTAHSSSTPHPQKQTSHSASFPCVCHGKCEF